MRVEIVGCKITGRTIDIRSNVYDDTGALLTKEPLQDSLETEGTHTQEQVLAFVKRKAIAYIQQKQRVENIVENVIKKFPSEIEITEDDLKKTDPMEIPEAEQ